MNKLLVINSSGRVTRSVTRRLTERFVDRWKATHSGGKVIQRDIGQNCPPAVSEPWVAAAYSDPSEHDSAMQAAIAVSDELIDELMSADAVVMGVPIYNFSIPAQLKAWIDQIVRIRRTFDINPENENPYVPLVESRPVAVLVSAGDIELHPGGSYESLNFMEPYLQTILGFIGLTDVSFIHTGNEEFKDAKHHESVEAALSKIDALAESMPSPQ